MARDFNNAKSTDYNNKNKEHTNKKYNTNNLKNTLCFNYKKKGHYAANCKELKERRMSKRDNNIAETIMTRKVRYFMQ